MVQLSEKISSLPKEGPVSVVGPPVALFPFPWSAFQVSVIRPIDLREQRRFGFGGLFSFSSPLCVLRITSTEDDRWIIGAVD